MDVFGATATGPAEGVDTDVAVASRPKKCLSGKFKFNERRRLGFAIKVVFFQSNERIDTVELR